MNLLKWIEPRSGDERTARQEQLVNIIALGSAAASTIYLLSLAVVAILGKGVNPYSLLGGVLAVSLSLLSYALARRGYVRAAAILIVAGTSLIGLYSAYVRGTITIAAVMLTPAVLFAGMAISGLASALTAVGELAVFILMTIAQDQGWIPLPAGTLSPLTGLLLAASVLGLITLITWQTMWAVDSFVRRIGERGRALQSMAGEKDHLLAELQAREKVQERLLGTVRELGSPIIPLAGGVIAMPLIGAVDSERAEQIMMALLRGVTTHRAHFVIVDITGIPVVDTTVAGALLKAAQGIRLLGAEPILTGIRAEVAQTIVGLGLDLSGVVTLATLQEGLAYTRGGTQS